jgi:misacylated tRNA(Ala) deacylase
MTLALYHNDSYIQEFSACVISINSDEYGIVLDQTAFYPGGGGQPNDTGQLFTPDQTISVVKVKKIETQIVHILDKVVHLPEVGQEVIGVVDWDRRYSLMRTHTAMHILCGVIFRDYGAQVTGGDMDPLNGRMDFEFETMHKELVAEIEEAVNKEVSLNRKVRTAILPRDEAFQIPDIIRTNINLLPAGIKEVRTVEIVGLDLQADGGTHVKSTSEVGRIRVTDYKSKGKINKRIYIELD